MLHTWHLDECDSSTDFQWYVSLQQPQGTTVCLASSDQPLLSCLGCHFLSLHYTVRGHCKEIREDFPTIPFQSHHPCAPPHTYTPPYHIHSSRISEARSKHVHFLHLHHSSHSPETIISLGAPFSFLIELAYHFIFSPSVYHRTVRFLSSKHKLTPLLPG